MMLKSSAWLWRTSQQDERQEKATEADPLAALLPVDKDTDGESKQ